MKIVVITGTSRGLGKAFFDYFIKQNVKLICIARKFSPYQQELEKNQNCYLIQQDLYDLKDSFFTKLEITLDDIINKNDEIIFINNAGTIDPIGSIGNVSNKSLEEAVKINFLAPVLLINKFIAIFIKKSIKMKIINISSGAANYPIEGWSGYCSTKAAVKMFLNVLKLQYKENPNISVIDVDPGVLDTQMQANIRSASGIEFPKLQYFCELNDSGKLKKPEEVVYNIMKEFLAE